MATTLNKGAQAAKTTARVARKVANPKSVRGQVAQGLMTKAEAVEQATVKRAGVQAAGRRAATGRAIERGVQERTARVATRKATEKATARMAQRAAAARAVPGVGQIIGAGLAGYAVGSALNEGFGLSTKVLDYQDRITGKTKASVESMTTTPKTTGSAGTAKGSRSRGGSRGKSRDPVASIARTSVPKVAAKPAAAKAAPKKASAKMVQVAVPAITRQRPAMQVSDVKQTVAKPSGMIAKRDISVGGLVGRTGGKWHLGKRPGKG